MFLRRYLHRPSAVTAAIFSQTHQFRSLSGPVDSIGKSKICNIVKSSLVGRFGVISNSKKVNENIPLQWAASFKNFIHSGNAKEFEAGGDSSNPEIGRSTVDASTNNGWNPRNTNFADPNMNNALNPEIGRSTVDASTNNGWNPRNTNFADPNMNTALNSILGGNAGSVMNRGWNPRNANSEIGASTVNPNLNGVPNYGISNFDRPGLDKSGFNDFYGHPIPRVNIEKDADIVHIKMLKNNTFVTVTDSNGNKKFGASSGKLSDKGGKVSRYAAEAIAEQIGRDARGRGIKSVVVKVNGFTYFKKKKQAILSLREGYSHSRGDKNPVVYIEDTTRRPHNGCRLRKKRRV